MKSPLEVSILEEAAHVCDTGLEAAWRAGRVGASEVEIANAAYAASMRAGADRVDRVRVRARCPSGPEEDVTAFCDFRIQDDAVAEVTPLGDPLNKLSAQIASSVLTAGPGTVKGIFTIDLPRPRQVAEIRFAPRFMQLYQEIWDALRDEVMVSYERDKKRTAS